MTRSPKILIPALLAVAAVAAFYFLLLSPKREEATRLEADITAKQAEVEQSRALLATYEEARDRYRVNYSTLTRVGKAVPADDDVRSLLVQLSAAAGRSKVDFHSVNIGASGASTGAATDTAAVGTVAPPPGAVAVGSAGFSAMPFSFGFEGRFFRLSDFLSRVERFVTVTNKDVDVTGRLLLVGSFSMAPEGDDDHLKAQLGAATYLVPAAQDVSGATPQGLGGGEQGAAPPAGGTSTTPTTSATITGVR